jgi:hypothetical protein
MVRGEGRDREERAGSGEAFSIENCHARPRISNECEGREGREKAFPSTVVGSP